MIRTIAILIGLGSIPFFASNGCHATQERAEQQNPEQVAFQATSDSQKSKVDLSPLELPSIETPGDDEKKLSDHIRARLQKSRSQWGTTGSEALTRISKFAPDFDVSNYRDRIEALVTGILPMPSDSDSPETKKFQELSKKVVTPSDLLTAQDEIAYEKILIGSISAIVDEAAVEAAKDAKPAVTATPAPVSAASGPNEVLARHKAYDIFSEKSKNDREKLLAAQSVKYFPGGKARKEGGFDKLTSSDQVDAVRKNTSDYVREKVRSGLKKKGAKQADIDDSLSEKGFASPEYQKNFQKFATDIVKSSGKPSIELDEIDGLTEEMRQELQTKLTSANDAYNKSENKDIARESKNLRAERLLDDAKKIVNELDPLEDELTEAKLASIKAYCDRISRPLILSDESPLATSDTIDDYKSSIYGKIRELYKEMGGFGRVMSIFGLKGYFAGIIADAMAKKLDRVLTSDERSKIDDWAASLASELHGSEPGTVQQPGTVIQYPPTSPYITRQMPAYPFIPVIPYGSHMGHKSWHGKSPVYVVPGMGGYVIAPR
jgi:hypothetical protein